MEISKYLKSFINITQSIEQITLHYKSPAVHSVEPQLRLKLTLLRSSAGGR